MTTITTESVETLLRTRARDALNDDLDEVLGAIENLYQSYGENAQYVALHPTLKAVDGSIAVLRVLLFDALAPIREANEIAQFLASTETESLVESSA